MESSRELATLSLTHPSQVDLQLLKAVQECEPISILIIIPQFIHGIMRKSQEIVQAQKKTYRQIFHLGFTDSLAAFQFDKIRVVPLLEFELLPPPSIFRA